MKNKTPIRLFMIVVFAVLLVLNNRQMKQSKFNTSNVEILKDLPPSLQVTSVALGPMKGLLADIIWWRAERMQENKEFFESMQLTEWMTSLQPTYPSVWAYQGFNLSFNVSYNFSNTDERWKWVYAGIELMRDRGLKYIPDWEANRAIRFEIVNIFARKMSGLSDKESRRFQDLWTLEMLKYFDSGDAEELEEIYEAHKSVDELLKDEDVIQLMQTFNMNVETFKNKILSQAPNLTSLKPDEDQYKQFNRAIMKIHRFDQRRRIGIELNMDVDKIYQVDQDFGPLDWRTHQAQIVYWGMETKQENFKNGGVNYSHYVRNAMLSSFYDGRVLFSEKKDYFMRTQNIEMLPRIHAYFDFALGNLEYGTKEYRRVDAVHKDFLEKAIVICYTYNQLEAAHDLFDHYEDYMEEEGKVLTFEQFIVRGMQTSLKSQNYKTRRSFIESILTRAFEDAAMGEWDKYHGYLNLARLVHRMHQKQFAGQEAKQLPALKQLFKAAKKSYALKTKKSDEEITDLENNAKQYKIPQKLSTGHE
jgi:hypothetical protein